MNGGSVRAAWVASVFPAVVIPAAVGAELAAALRARFERASYTRYSLFDRGSYDILDAPVLPDVFETLAGIANEVTGRSLSFQASRVLRLGPGDYLLTRHDRVYDDRPVELVLDLSPAPVEGAEIHWRHRGQVFFTMPTTPGALALVERGPTVMCNHTYVSKLQRQASVVRLVALFT